MPGPKGPTTLLGSLGTGGPSVPALQQFTLSPSDFRLKYEAAAAAAPAPEVHLTLPLSKPMHQYTEAELHGLITELESDGFLEQEETIARITNEALMAWRGQRKYPTGSPQYTTHVIPAKSQTYVPNAVPAMVTHTMAISVHVPTSIPERYVRAFIERMVRDQIEEA